MKQLLTTVALVIAAGSSQAASFSEYRQCDTLKSEVSRINPTELSAQQNCYVDLYIADGKTSGRIGSFMWFQNGDVRTAIPVLTIQKSKDAEAAKQMVIHQIVADTLNMTIANLEAQLEASATSNAANTAEIDRLEAALMDANARLISIQSDLDDANADVTSLNSQITTLTASETALQDRITTLTETIQTLEDNADISSDTIDGLRDIVAGLNATITDLNGDITTLTNDRDAAILRADGLQVMYDEASVQLTASIAQVSAHVATIDTITTERDQLVIDLATATAAVTTANDRITTLTADIATLTTNAQDNIDHIEDIKAALSRFGPVETPEGRLQRITDIVNDLRAANSDLFFAARDIANAIVVAGNINGYNDADLFYYQDLRGDPNYNNVAPANTSTTDAADAGFTTRLDWGGAVVRLNGDLVSSINPSNFAGLDYVIEQVWDEGYKAGYDDGYDAGYADGYRDGFSDGVNEVANP